MTSVEQAQKFHTYDMSLPRSESLAGLIAWSKFSTNQKHYLDLSRDISLVWNFCTHSSDIILLVNQRWHHQMFLFSQLFSKGTNCQHSTTTVGVKNLGEQWMRSGESAHLPKHQCAPGLTPGVNAICRLSLLLVLSLALKGSSLGTPVFPSPQKPTLPNSNSIWNARTRLNVFIWTTRYFMGKQAIYNFFLMI